MDTTGEQPKRPRTSQDQARELDCLVGAVREAGDVAMGYFGSSPASELKADGTSVSEADLAVDALLKTRLPGSDEGYGWLSEEHEDDRSRLGMEKVWIVDPIDGTRAFLKERPEWTIAAALVEQGRPMLSAVYNPATGEFFHAVRGQGAFLNETAIRVSDAAKLNGCRLAASQTQIRHKSGNANWPEIETVWVNSIAYRLALVACGSCDGTVSLSGKHEWDLAAAQLLVEEAGGVVTTHDGSGLVYNRKQTRHPSVVSAGPGLHTALIELTSQATL